MSRAVSVFSSARISEEGLKRVMEHLKAVPDSYGWLLSRNDRSVYIELGSEDIPDMPEDMIRDVTIELGKPPRSRAVLIFNDFAEDQFEYRMARAVAIAMAELWPIAWNDHAGTTERIYPPGGDPAYN